MSFVNFALVLFSASTAFAANLPAYSSFYSNSSTQYPATTIAPSGAPCCLIVPQTVGLNFWWNQSLTITYATVLTQYLQYNNTVILNTTTIYNASATQGLVVPTDIIPGYLLYSETFFDIGTTIDLTTTTLTYPTPYVAINSAFYVTGTYSMSAGEQMCQQDLQNFNPVSNIIQLTAEYDFVPATSTFWSAGTYVNAPTQLKDTILAIPSVTESFPMIASCSLVSGSGQPSVHLPVSALTTHGSTTITVGGFFSGSVGSSAAEVTPPPVSSSQYTPPPSSAGNGQPPASENQPSSAPAAPPASSSVIGAPVPPSSANGASPISSVANNPPPTSQNQPSSHASIQTPPPVVVIPPAGVSSIQIGSTVIPVSFASASGGGIVLPGGATLSPGIVTTINGVGISLAPSETAVVVGGSTIILPVSAAASFPSVFAIQVGSSVITAAFASASGGGVVLPGGATLSPGAVTTINGVGVSLAPSETAVVVGGSTVVLPVPATPSFPSIFTIQVGSSAITAAFASASGGGIILPGGATLLPGTTTVVNGETIALVPSGTALVVDGTETIKPVPFTPAPAPAPTTLLVGSSALPITYATATGGGVILPNGGTLLPGSTTVYNGVTISLTPSETAIVVAGSTVPLTPPSVATSSGVGGYILSGLGGAGGISTASGSGTQTAGYTGPLATGAAGRIRSLGPLNVFLIAAVIGAIWI
ncbi:uncharacterized protein BDZ99DRAFT_473163 [Mytilinidion resinicola]|uniref:Uncharacterized protein n=1 Tax=Mytilinidion resinicola TaxID=574789 RepID=A0A6A6YZS5_9PEZI|nr:uncharacterized protein BDZ99DRAFT_473163 [Mytilinidion resinicola]KAF2814038.1 hypothetical protein BDZ99DRAFT_473163 [Mytilinidion resinicola]